MEDFQFQEGVRGLVLSSEWSLISYGFGQLVSGNILPFLIERFSPIVDNAVVPNNWT